MNKEIFGSGKSAHMFCSSLLTAAAIGVCSPATASISISEIHYDNVSTDVGEAIEVEGPTGTDLSGWQLALYNGKNGKLYNTSTLSGELSSVPGCSDAYSVIRYPSNGLQNGSPDGVALIDANGSVAEFISYEGDFAAIDGPASGLTSVNIGVTETSSTPTGYSLQKINGQWQAPQPENFGSCAGIAPPSPSPSATPTPTLTPSAQPSASPSPTPAPITTRIHDIQGISNAIAITGSVAVEAIVTADYQNSNQLKGFFIQEEDADTDNNDLTSEAIFVYCSSCSVDVSVGDKVAVSGNAQDYQGMSQISAQTISVLASQQTLPQAQSLQLPITANNEADIDAFYERVEGMLVEFNTVMTLSESYNLGRYGQLLLTQGGKIRQFTDISEPSAAGLTQHTLATQARSILLDDGSSKQNQEPVFYPRPGFSAENTLRGGDTLTSLGGVLHFSFSAWRIQPVEALFNYDFTSQNPRQAAPDTSTSDLSVASFNVLNYFASIDSAGTKCGPGKNLGCRGADSEQEFLRQQSKITGAICAMDADIIGLMEIENDSDNVAIGNLVEALNSGCGPYQAVNTGAMGDDAIRVGLLFKPDAVTTIGNTAILDSQDFVNPNFTAVDKNRPALAQSFEINNHDQKITVVVNHLKSKGSKCSDSIDPNDDDLSSGQGNCNGTRTQAALAEIAWLNSSPTGIDSNNVLVLGDLNAYRKEAPVSAFTDAGYVDLIDAMLGADAYSYVFKGAWGYLDHALASEALAPLVSGVYDWHINADEVPLLDYNGEFKPTNYASDIYTASPWRSSDHDPVVVTFDFPEKQSGVSDLISVFSEYYQAKQIYGAGSWYWQKHWNIKMFAWGLYSAQHFQVAENMVMACRALHWASALSDAQRFPKDRISGEKVPALNNEINSVQQALNCL